MTDATHWHLYNEVNLSAPLNLPVEARSAPPAMRIHLSQEQWVSGSEDTTASSDAPEGSWWQVAAAVLFVFSGPIAVAAASAVYILTHGEF